MGHKITGGAIRSRSSLTERSVRSSPSGNNVRHNCVSHWFLITSRRKSGVRQSWGVPMSVRFLGTATAAAILFSVASVTPVSAATYNFTQITDNGDLNVAANLQADVNLSASSAAFTFKWITSALGTIAQIYFDDDANVLASMTCCTDSGASVNFAANGAPPNLPAGNDVNPDFAADFRVSADSPAPSNGVDVLGEFVTVLFSIELGKTFADVIGALNGGTLRLGMHVISINSPADGSESLVNLTPVPVPAALLLFGSAIAWLGLLARRRRQSVGVPA